VGSASRTTALLAALALAAGCSAAPRPWGDGVGLQALFSGGYRSLAHDDFEGHAVYGIDIATREYEGGWGYEIGASYGTEDASGPRDHSIEINEYSLGMRRTWERDDGDARPYVGFGGTLAQVEHTLHAPRDDFEDHGAAAYVRGGVLWYLGRYSFDRGTEMLAGFDVRGELGDDYDALQLALVFGFGR
jgi:hypothetical protein